MIKIIKVYKDSRILENGTLDTLGLAVRTDNEVDILRFKFDELPEGVGTLLTTLEDENHELVAFPLTRNDEENSFDLVITQALVSQLSLTFQLQIAYNNKIWNSLMATLEVHDCLEIGTGEMPTTIENWLQNANLVMSGYQDKIDEWGQDIEQAVTGAENVNIEVEEGQDLYNVTITDREGNEYQAVIYQGKNAIISGATASLDNTVGTPSVNVTMGGTESDRTFDFAFHNLKGDKGDKGDTGEPGAIKYIMVQTLPTEDIQTDALYFVPSDDPKDQDLYDEYMYINEAWELIGKKRIVVDLTDYVKNTDYATSSKGGVIKSGYYGLQVDSSNGKAYCDTYNYTNYGNVENQRFVSKGTLENVITGKNLETANNKVTSISSSSTNIQYPSAKCVYDSQATQDTKITNLENQVFGDETIEGEGTSLTLDGTLKGVFNEIGLKGNTSQTGTPTPTSPIPVNVVSGDNEIKIHGKNFARMENGTYTYGNNTGVITENNIMTLNTSGSTGNNSYFSFGSGYTQQYAPTSNIASVPDMNITPDGGTYTANIITNKVMSGTSITFYFWTSLNRNFQIRIDSGTSKTISITLNEGEHIKDFGLWNNSATVYSNYEVKVMLEKGSSASTYEPYQGNTYNIDLPVENLLSASEHLYGTSNGIKTTYSDEKYNISGTASASWAYIANNVSINLPAGTYTLSLTKTLPFRIYVTFTYDDNTTSTLAINSGSTSTSYTLTGQVVKYELSVSQMTSGTTYNETLGVLLEKGSKANTYTPYGTTPIELSYQDEFRESDGTNLFDVSSSSLSKYIDTSGNLQNTNNSDTSDYIEVEANEQYTLSFDYKEPLNSQSQREIVLYNSSKTFVSTITLFAMTDKIKTFTPTQSGYIRFDYDKKCFNIQLEKGSSSSNWQPYGLGNWYKYSKYKKITLDGTNYYVDVKNSSTTDDWRVTPILSDSITPSSNNVVVDIYSSHFEKKSANNIYLNDGSGIAIMTSKSMAIEFPLSKGISTVQLANNWLQANKPVAYYPLENAITQAIPSSLNEQLKEFKKAQSKENQTNISQVNNDLPFIISASAFLNNLNGKIALINKNMEG